MGQLSFIDYNVQVIDQDLSSLNHGTCNHLILFPNKNWKRNKNTHINVTVVFYLCISQVYKDRSI